MACPCCSGGNPSECCCLPNDSGEDTPFGIDGNLSEDSTTYYGAAKSLGLGYGYTDSANGISVCCWPNLVTKPGYSLADIANGALFENCPIWIITDSVLAMASTNLFTANVSLRWRHSIRAVTSTGCDGTFEDITSEVFETRQVPEGGGGASQTTYSSIGPYELEMFTDFGHSLPTLPDYLSDDNMFACDGPNCCDGVCQSEACNP